MKNCLLIFVLVRSDVTFAQLSPGQFDRKKVPMPYQHYLPEYTFDTPADPSRWEKQKHGLNVAFGSTDELYLRSEVPTLQAGTQTWEGTGWKGERLNAQILAWSPDTVQQIRFSASDLQNAKGQIISKSSIQMNIGRHVLSKYPNG